jgi:hypothetical protein
VAKRRLSEFNLNFQLKRAAATDAAKPEAKPAAKPPAKG